MSRFASHVSSRVPALTALAAGALATAALLVSPAIATAAQPSVDVLQTTVYYSYSDLNSDRGTRALYQRIASAAREVCPGYNSPDLAAVADSRLCQQEAVARAVRQVGSAHLAAVYSQKLPRRG